MIATQSPAFRAKRPFLLPHPGSGAVLWLPGQDDPQSGTIRDRSGKGNNGTISGATWGRLSSGLWALNFDGVDDYVDCGSGASLMLTGNPDISVMAWFKPDDFDNHNIIYAYGVRTGSNMLQFYTSQTSGYIGLAMVANDNISTTVVTSGAWHHVALTMTGTTSKLYLDGISVSTKTDHGAVNILSGAGYVGNDNGGAAAHDCDGQIGLLSVLNRVLSDAEIASNFNRDRHLFAV